MRHVRSRLLSVAVLMCTGAGATIARSSIRAGGNVLDGEIAVVAHLGSATNHLTLDGVLLYSAGTSGLQVFDSSSPAMPTLLGELLLDSPAYRTLAKGGMAYVLSSRGLHIVDVADPTAPHDLGLVEVLEPTGLATDGMTAYVTDANGLYVIDVTTPSAPHVLRYPDLENFDALADSSVALVKGLLYGESSIWDVRNPATPTLVAQSGLVGGRVRVLDDVAYVLRNGLRVLDVSNPAAPRQLGSLSLSCCLGAPSDLDVIGTVAYVSSRAAGLQVIDVSMPGAMRELARLDTPGVAAAVAVRDTFAYVADVTDGLRVASVVGSAAPQEVDVYNRPTDAARIAVDGPLAYLAGAKGGISVVDISSPQDPRLVGEARVTADAGGVATGGGLVYIAVEFGGLVIVDVSDPENPVQRGALTWPFTGLFRDVAARGRVVLVPAQFDGLRVVDAVDPNQPREIGAFNPPGSRVESLALDGNLAILVGDRRLWIVDIANPSSIVPVGEYQTQASAADAAVGGGYAFVATDEALEVIDIRDPSSPNRVAMAGYDGAPARIALGDGSLWVGGEAGEVTLFDISTPSQPRAVGVFHPAASDADWAPDIALAGGLAYVADLDAGLFVLRRAAGNGGGGGCTSAADCGDGNPCTADACAAGSCRHPFDKRLGPTCLIRALESLVCEGEVLPPKLASRLRRNSGRAVTLVERALASPKIERRRRLLRKAENTIGAVLKPLRRASRRGQITAACKSAVNQLIEEAGASVRGVTYS